MNQAFPPIPRASWSSCSRTSAALQAASAERSAAATECSSTTPAVSSAAGWGKPDAPARRAGSSWACAWGRKSWSSSDGPAALRPAWSDSSTSATPPTKSTRYLPGLTGPHSSSSTRARLATASAATTPRASDETSSKARASDNAELVLERAAALAGEGPRGGEALAPAAGDGPGGVPLAAHAQPGIRRRVLDEEARVHRPPHVLQLVHALPVHHRSVEEAVLGAHRLADGHLHGLHPHHPHHPHRQLRL